MYKSKKAKEIIDSYLGHRRLIESENEREKLMLDNIKESIENKALEQHKEKLKIDKKIDKSGVNKKIEQVSSAITDHIVKGNEIKLLMAPTIKETDYGYNLSDDLREEAAIVRERYKNLNAEDKQLLLDKYSINEPDEKDGDQTAKK